MTKKKETKQIKFLIDGLALILWSFQVLLRCFKASLKSKSLSPPLSGVLKDILKSLIAARTKIAVEVRM